MLSIPSSKDALRKLLEQKCEEASFIHGKEAVLYAPEQVPSRRPYKPKCRPTIELEDSPVKADEPKPAEEHQVEDDDLLDGLRAELEAFQRTRHRGKSSRK